MVMYGSHTGKIVPLIICDLNTVAIAVESMLGVKAEHVYLGLQRLQFRFGTEVIQAYTDKGSQLGKMLGKKNEYWSTKLRETWPTNRRSEYGHLSDYFGAGCH